MLEIFIPTQIKNISEINIISDIFLDIIKNNFSDVEISNFSSTFFEGLKLKADIFIEDLIILVNGEFGEFYFVDFDYLENSFDFKGVKIIGENKIGEKINEVMLNIAEVTGMLNSDKLLTNSRKELIKIKLNSSFFALSGIIFLLYSLKEQTEVNLSELENVGGGIEYEGQAQLLSETLITKKIELQATIDKLEIKIELFLDTVKLLIK